MTCPEKLWMFHHWRYSILVEGIPAQGKDAGLDDL